MTLLLALLMALTPADLIVLQRYAELHDRPALDEGLHDEQASAFNDRHQWIVEDCGRRSRQGGASGAAAPARLD